MFTLRRSHLHYQLVACWKRSKYIEIGWEYKLKNTWPKQSRITLHEGEGQEFDYKGANQQHNF